MRLDFSNGVLENVFAPLKSKGGLTNSRVCPVDPSQGGEGGDIF